MRINIHQKDKSGCEHFINHYKNVCKGGSFSIKILEKLGMGDFISTYPYDLIERTKNSNLEHATSKLFQPLPRFGNRRENLSINQTNLRQLTPY